MNVEASARFRNFAQAFLIEAGGDDVSLLVAHHFISPPRGHDERCATRRAEADGENPKRVLVLLRSLKRVLLQVLAIGEQNQCAMCALAFAKSLVRSSDCSTEIRPALWNDFGIQLFQRIAHGIVVRRKRSLEKCASRKRDEANAIAVEIR